MSLDARRHVRSKITPIQRGGIFQLEAGGQFFRFNEVDNVSVSGAGLHIPATLTVGTPVVLTYTEGDFQVITSGWVVWSERPRHGDAAESERRCRVGVRFDMTNAESNQLLFMALREYIDPFSWPH